MTLPFSTRSHSVLRSGNGFEHLMDTDKLTNICQTALASGADFSEIYIEKCRSTWITLSEGKINLVRSGLKEGAGVRVIRGLQTGYAYCEDLDPDRIQSAAETAAFITQGERIGAFPIKIGSALKKRKTKIPYYPLESDGRKRTQILRRADQAARAEDQRIQEVNVTYYDEEKEIYIVNSDGNRFGDRRSLFSFHVFVLAEEGNGVQNSGYATGGGRFPFSRFDIRTPEMIGREAAQQALRKLKSRECPAGMFPVIINKGWGGVLIHEAVGHGLESDFNYRGSSVYAGQIGRKVASEKVTLIDDGTCPNGRGSFNVDDEGTPTQKNILIENGILKNFLYDTYHARHMNAVPTGNGRRENFTQLPLPRMTNTYIAQGKDDPEDMIGSVKQGLFAQTLGGGQVDIASGNFVFEVQEGYWIENGKISYPVKGANLIGNGRDILKKITGVGYDLEIETGAGMCGKNGQNIPVGVGQPTIKIEAMTIGGTKLGTKI